MADPTFASLSDDEQARRLHAAPGLAAHTMHASEQRSRARCPCPYRMCAHAGCGAVRASLARCGARPLLLSQHAECRQVWDSRGARGRGRLRAAAAGRAALSPVFQSPTHPHPSLVQPAHWQVRRFQCTLDGDLLVHWCHFAVAFVEVFKDDAEAAALLHGSMPDGLAALQRAQEVATIAKLIDCMRGVLDGATATALMGRPLPHAVVGHGGEQEQPGAASAECASSPVLLS
eukprot:5976882-Prymnesium_polylepis.1